MTNEDENSGSPADDLAAKLNRMKEIEKWIKKLETLLDIAKRCDLDRTMVDKGFTSCKSAYNKFYKTDPDLNGAYSDLLDANISLTDSIVKARIGPIPTLKYFSFQSMIYGWTAIATALLTAIVFIFLLMRYQCLQTNQPLIALAFNLHDIHWRLPLISWRLPSELLGIPLWAALFAGLGASIQILIGVVAEIRANGVVCDYKRVWYIVLPVVALIFGYLAYLLIDLGLVTLGGSQGGQGLSFTAANISLIKATGVQNLTNGNTSFIAHNVSNLTATGVGSFTANVGIEARIVACFLAGYSTDAFIKKLTNLAEKM